MPIATPVAVATCEPITIENGRSLTPSGISKPSENPSHKSINPSIVQPRHSCAPNERYDGANQSFFVSGYICPICVASCPIPGAKVPISPWRCMVSMRVSNLRVSTIAR